VATLAIRVQGGGAPAPAPAVATPAARPKTTQAIDLRSVESSASESSCSSVPGLPFRGISRQGSAAVSPAQERRVVGEEVVRFQAVEERTSATPAPTKDAVTDMSPDAETEPDVPLR
jgi:hypothetical protein